MKIDVKKVASLANLSLTESDNKKLAPQLEEIVSYIQKLNKIDSANIEPTSQVTGLTNVLRDDSQLRPSLSQEEALSGTKNQHNGAFQVEGILEEK